MPSMNTHFLVRNLRSTSHRACTCGTWMDHWYNDTGSSRSTCSVLGCSNEASVGAHVLDMDGRAGWEEWIVPMCHSHNHHSNDEEMWLDSRIILVSANTKRMGCYR